MEKGAAPDCRGTLYIPGPHAPSTDVKRREAFDRHIDIRDERCLTDAPKEGAMRATRGFFIPHRGPFGDVIVDRVAVIVAEPLIDAQREREWWFRRREIHTLYTSPAIIENLRSEASISSGRRDNILRFASLYGGGTLTRYVDDGAGQVLNLNDNFLIGASAKTAVRIAYGSASAAHCVPRLPIIRRALATIKSPSDAPSM